MSAVAVHDRASTARLGMWLFLASEAMLFGSVFSGYALLRAGAPSWPPPDGVLSLGLALVQTALLVAVVASARPSRGFLVIGTVTALAFVGLKLVEYNAKIAAGMTPASNLMLASWFTLTGMHVVHVAGGAAVNGWLAGPGWAASVRDASCLASRVEVMRLYWIFVDVVWLAILVSFYFI